MADDTLSPDEEQLADFWHGQGMSNAGVAGMLGTFSQEAGSGGYNAFNDSSGASGAYQYLGSRAKAETSYASARGGDPWDPQIQNEYAARELRGQADSGNERAIGTALFNATDPSEAADNMVRGFERPGGDVIDAESGRAQARARAVHPLLEARYGGDAGRGNPNMVAPLTNSGPKETYDGSDPEYQKAFAAMGQAIQPAGTPGKWDHATLPPTVRSPQPDAHGDAMSLMGQAMQDQIYADKEPSQAGNGASPTSWLNWGPVGHALLSVVPRGLARGFLTTLGLPADLANAAGDFYATHQNNAAVVGMAGGNPGSAMGMALAQSLGLPTSADQLPVYDPNTKGVHIPAGTSDLQALVKNTTGVDTTPQYNNTGEEVLGHMAEFIGAGLSPGGIVGDARALGGGIASVSKSVLGMLFHHVLAPAGISGGADVGQWAVDKASGSQAAGNAAGIALRAGLAGGLIAGASRGARAGREFIENAPQNAISQAMKEGHGELAAGGATDQAIANLSNYQEPIPGYTTPAALQTGDAALQQFAADVLSRDQRMHNDFVKPDGLATQNINALEAMRPAGNAEDPVQAVQNMQARRQSMIDMRVAQARDAAQQAEEQAVQGRPQGGALGQTAAFQQGQDYINELREARNDAFAHADESWQNARDLGFTNVQADTSPMYSQLENLMAENIRLRQGADFPWQQVNDLYQSGAPRAMFDKLGNRLPSTVGGGDQLFAGGATLEQLKGVDSRLGNAIRMEQDAISTPGNRGNPSLLRNLMQVRDAVWGAIERGATQAGPEHTVALRNAMDATAQAYGTFGHGLIGQLLNDRNGAANAPEILRKYLGNTQNAIQAASMFRAAMEQRTGAAAARSNLQGFATGMPMGATPQDQFMNTLSDWMRQDYLNTRADLGTRAAQKWLTTRQGMFSALQGNRATDDLHNQLMNWQNSADVALPQVEGAAKTESAELAHNAAQLFLNGNPGARLDSVLKAKNPAGAMGEIIQDVKQDGTGQAFRGLQDMFTNRVFDEAQVRDPMRPGQTYYSGAAAKKFLDSAQPALDRLAQEDPQWAAGLRRVVETMALEDRARMGTGMQLTGIPGMSKQGWSAAGSLATKATQYALAHVVGRNLPAAGLQGEALSSQFGKEIAQNIPPKISKAINKLDPTDAVRAVVRDALHDPEKLRGLLAPVTGPSGARWAGHIEPWLKATGVELPQGWLNPQNQQEPGDDTLP